MATESEQELYGYGLCHVHAMAAVRLHGGGYLIVTDPEEIVWHHPEDADLDQVAVVHVYSVHATPAGPVARDVFGDRPLEAAADEARERYACWVVESDLTDDQDDLLALVDSDGECERPLSEFSEADVLAALAVETVKAPIEAPARDDVSLSPG